MFIDICNVRRVHFSVELTINNTLGVKQRYCQKQALSFGSLR